MAEIKSLAQRATTVRDLVMKYIPQITTAIPRGMDANRFARIALTMLPSNPKLLECDPKSLLGGILQAAAWGLELDPVLGMSYLVPYGNKAQIIIGYQGLITLARRSGEVRNIIPQSVYEKDTFEFELGLRPKLRHVPANSPDRGALIGVYAVASMKDGDPEFRFMWKHEVDAIRARSRAKDSGPWVTDYEAMAWKTVIRRLCKYLPRTVELARALDMDERVDAGIEQNLEDSFGVTIDAEPVAEQKSGLDALTAKLANGDTVDQKTGEITQEPVTQPDQSRNATDEEIQRANDARPVDPIQPGPAKRGRPAAMPSAGDIFEGQKREPGQEG